MRATSIAMVLLLCCHAWADASDDAKALFVHGRAQYALHHFAEAASDFEKAFELKPDPAILYNAAQAHRFAGNKQRSLELYESYVRLYGDQPNAREASQHAQQLRDAIEVERKATSAPSESIVPPSTTSDSAATAVTAAPPAKKPIYKKAWFWGVIGGGAAVVIVGVGLGVGLGAAKKDPMPTYGVANGN